jgi:hypothetical protein
MMAPDFNDFAADQFRRCYVKGSFDFHVAVAMNAAPAFLERGKKRSREWLQVRAFLFKAGRHLFARRAMDARVGDAAFPVLRKRFSSARGLEATALERIGANVSDSPLQIATHWFVGGIIALT